MAYSEIVKAARHILFWNQAKIIYPINLKQIYVINNDIFMQPLQEISRKFQQKFAHIEKITFEKVMTLNSFVCSL